MLQPIYQFSATNIDGQPVPLSQYQGKTLLIVNVASKCGFTPQYEGLEELYQKYKDKGFEILAFPCNQFAHQEPGNAKEIKTFCSINYNITFPLFDKIEVNGDKTHPLYKYLKSQKKGFLFCSAIKWNFTKFLVDKNGNVVKRFAPTKKPEQIEEDLLKIL